MSNEKTCFFVSAIGNENSSERKNSDELFTYILVPICEKLDFKCIRIDKLSNPNNISDDILKNLQEADLVIADLTFLNPNVFYEIGFRTALAKPIIHIAKEGTELPFDIRQFRCIFYTTDGFNAKDDIKNKLLSAINSINFDITIDSKTEEKTSHWELEQITNNLFDEIKEIKSISIEIKSKLSGKNFSNDTDINQDIMQILFDKVFENPEKLLKLAQVMDNINKS